MRKRNGNGYVVISMEGVRLRPPKRQRPRRRKPDADTTHGTNYNNLHTFMVAGAVVFGFLALVWGSSYLYGKFRGWW